MFFISQKVAIHSLSCNIWLLYNSILSSIKLISFNLSKNNEKISILSSVKYINNGDFEDWVVYGCDSLDSCDYPIFAKKVANDVSSNASDFGVLICTTGIGMSITANKFKGVRAALVMNEESAHLTRMHNNSNVICMGAKFTPYEEAVKYLDAFLEEQFEGGRHQRRVDQIED